MYSNFHNNDKEPIKVLVVDDSPLMQRVIKSLVELDKNIKVIEVASNGREAIRLAKMLKPDVITLDINMPELDGLSVLKILVREKIAPIIVVSIITQKEAPITYETLEYGAFDYVPKPINESWNALEFGRELREKIILAYMQAKKSAILHKLAEERFTLIKKPVHKKDVYQRIEARIVDFYGVGIGISTGGPKNIYNVLPPLPSNLNAAIFVVQHMPPFFTKQYAEHLDNYCQMKVLHAEDGMLVVPGNVYVAQGGFHLTLERNEEKLVIRLANEPKHTFMPSADVTLSSIAKVFREKSIGIIMTGMGNDGVEGLAEIKKVGGLCFAESEETAIVFGMPKEAIKAGVVDKVLPSYMMPEEIIKTVGTVKTENDQA
ncbi:MAG: protein-glutamate methylesterase/protein-glutamine glutaminase [Fervidobacterium sp.]|uniref:protein-glutamate methylesterase/protein-glutamine glutaminase n=1 Tax=Fervidobacterium sp. TaxID=1871331 RepID=UPI00404A9E60